MLRRRLKFCRYWPSVMIVLGMMVSPPAAICAAPAAQSAGAPASGAARFLGKVSASATDETRHPLKVFKNQQFCGASVPDETLLIGAGGGVANAVVTLTPIDRVISAPPGRVILDNRKCAFVPHVQVATLGSDLLLRNSDPILHTVHARLGKETLFNVGLPTWRRVTKRLDRAGVMRIDCDVLHTWMSAAILVVRTPYFTISDTNGHFALDALPPGAYELEVWHERLGMKKGKVNLQENSAAAVEVVYAARSAAH